MNLLNEYKRESDTESVELRHTTVRLPENLLKELEEQGNKSEAIREACQAKYGDSSE